MPTVPLFVLQDAVKFPRETARGKSKRYVSQKTLLARLILFWRIARGLPMRMEIRSALNARSIRTYKRPSYVVRAKTK
jgi:hypothetical protein